MTQNRSEKEYDQGPVKQDLWSEYMDSLDENGNVKEDDPGINVSDRVLKDLDSFAANGAQFKREARRERRRSSSDSAKTAVIITAATVAAIAIAGVGLITSIADRDSYSYSVDPSEWDIPSEEYVDPYTMLDQDLTKPQFILDDSVYELPVNVSEFESQGWTITEHTFGDTIAEVGADPVTVTFSRWGNSFDAMLVSPDGTPVSPDQAVVVAIGTTDSYFLQLPFDIYVGEYEYSVEDSLENSGVEWTKIGSNHSSEYRISSQVDNEIGYNQYDLKLRMQDDSLTSITMQLSKGE